MTSQAEGQVVGVVRELSRCTRALSSVEARQVARVAEVSKEVLRVGVRAFVGKVDPEPCSRSTSSDGTPITVSHRIAAELPSGRVYRRSGKACHEFQVGLSFYKSSDPAVHPRVLLRELVPMTHGKKALAEFEIVKLGGISLRAAGHTGEVVEHYAWDRAKFTALARLAKAWHNAEVFARTTTVTSDMLSLTQFVVCTPCALHDVNKAQQWAMLAEFSDKDLLRDCFVVVAALRNSIDLITTHIGMWISSRLQFVEPLCSDEIQDFVIMWVALGLDGELADLLAGTLQLRFEAGLLKVSSDCGSMHDLVSVVQSTLLAAWKIERFTESRWQTVGSSSRGVVAGCMTGLPGLIDYILTETKSSTYFLGGWRRLVGDRLSFMVCCSLVSRISDSLLVALMEDGRVVRNITQLKEIVHEDVAWLVNLPLNVYAKLGELCKCGAMAFRDMCLKAAHINVAFVHDRVFRHVHEYPFSLAVGGPADFRNSLQNLRTAERPQEQVALQLWQLVRMGYSTNRLVKVLQLIQDLEWSTLAAEQLHATAAALMRHHPDYGVDTLLARSMVNVMNKLLPSKSQEEKQLDRLRERFGRCAARCPDRIGGQHVFVGDLMAVAAKKYGTAADGSRRWSKVIIRQASAAFAKLSDADKRNYSAQASARVEHKRVAQREEMDELRAAISLSRARLEEEATESQALRLSACSLEGDDFDTFVTLSAMPAFHGGPLKALRDAAQVAPPLPASAEVLRLADHTVWEATLPRGSPWLSSVATLRDFFGNVAFCLHRGADVEYWKFVFARQSPVQVFVSRLEPLPVAQPAHVPRASTWECIGKAHVAYRFKVQHLTSIDAATWGVVEMSDVMVLDDLRHGHGACLETARVPRCLQAFIDILPLQECNARRAAGPVQRPSSSGHDLLLQQYPWLADLWPEHKPHAWTTSPDAASAKGPKVDECLDDDEIEAIFSELDRRRAELAASTPAELAVTDFAVKVLGGAWTRSHRGVDADAMQGHAVGNYAKQFCRRRGVAMSARFEISLYSATHASVFARAWAHRMQHFLNCEVAAGDEKYAFSEQDVARYSEPTEFAQAAKALQSQAQAVKRVQSIRALFVS